MKTLSVTSILLLSILSLPVFADDGPSRDLKGVSCHVVETSGHRTEFYDVAVPMPKGDLDFAAKIFPQLNVSVSASADDIGPFIWVTVQDSKITGSAELAHANSYSAVLMTTKVGETKDQTIEVECIADHKALPPVATPNPKAASCRITETNGAHNTSFFDVAVQRPSGDLTIQGKMFPQLHLELSANDRTDQTELTVTITDDGIKGASNSGESMLANLTGYNFTTLFTKVGESLDKSINVDCDTKN